MASSMLFIASKSKDEKQKTVVLTLTQKIDICRSLEGENHNVLMKEFSVGLSMIYDIKGVPPSLLLKNIVDFLKKLVAKHGLSPDQIYNADETVKLLVVGKCNRPRAFKGIRHLPVVCKAQSNAWMDKEKIYDWFHHVFVPSVKEHFRKNGKPEDSKSILLLDSCQAHPPECELVSGNSFTIFLPPDVTSLIQPMDQVIIQNMKCYYRRDFLRQLMNQEGTIQNFQCLYNIKDTIFNVPCAWNSVKSKTLRRAWRKLWPRVMFAEGSSDEEDFEGLNVRHKKNTIAQILEVVKDAPSTNPVNKLKESEIEEWVEADKEVEHVFSDAEIIERRLWWRGKMSWASTASSIDNFIKFAERWSYFAREVMQLHIIHKKGRQQVGKHCRIPKCLLNL
uniref:DDE-1 domain-containing protein n=1 Tax=Crocodylus porosus TaxID=8502 RepID=A0A7M4DWB0_CROPO